MKKKNRTLLEKLQATLEIAIQINDRDPIEYYQKLIDMELQATKS